MEVAKHPNTEQCPCNSAWKSHGAYVSCVSNAAGALLAAGSITQAEKDATVSAAAGSSFRSKK